MAPPGVPLPPLKQFPFIEKHPPLILIPLLNVEVAEPVTFRAATCNPPANVDVAVEVASNTDAVVVP